MKLTRRLFSSLPCAALLSRMRGATAVLAAAPPAPATLPGRARAVSVAAEIQRQIYTRKALERMQKKFVFRQPNDPDGQLSYTGQSVTWDHE